MKRFTLFGGALLLLGFVMTGCDTSDAVGPEGLADTETQAEARPTYGGNTCDATGSGYDYCVDLVAGQTQDVGDVYYDYDGTTFRISYQLTTPGLCLDVVHFGVYDETNQIPTVGRGNVAPGSLTYQFSPDGCATSYADSFEASFNDSDYYVLAHAGVVGSVGGIDEASCPVIAGIGHGANAAIYDDLYYVNPNSGTSQFFYNTGRGGIVSPLGGVPTLSYPNGLALDVSTNTYYYADAQQNLFSHVPGSGTQTGVGVTGHLDAGATIANGVYYYMKQSSTGNSGDDDLIARNLGTGVETEVCSDFMLPDGQYDLEFGDLAYNAADGRIYTSVYLDNENTTVVDMVTRFFSVDPLAGGTCGYNLIRERAGDEKLQLAFGSDGVLYGHSTGNAPTSPVGTFYSIDLVTGDRTDLGTINNAAGVLLQFNDLAPANVDCGGVDFDETAWGWGQQTFGQLFGGRQWGWVFGGTF